MSQMALGTQGGGASGNDPTATDERISELCKGLTRNNANGALFIPAVEKMKNHPTDWWRAGDHPERS